MIVAVIVIVIASKNQCSGWWFYTTILSTFYDCFSYKTLYKDDVMTPEETKVKQAMDQVSEDILRPFKEPIKAVYIDADFLYDYRLGELLLKVTCDEDYNVVLKHLDEYINGTSFKITKYFPELNLTEEDLDLLERDPVLGKYVQVAAPPTKFLFELPKFIIQLNTYNKNREENSEIKIYINTRGHKMNSAIWGRLADGLEKMCPNVRLINTTYSNWTEIPPNVYDILDILYVYNMQDFMSVGSVSCNKLQKRESIGKIVITRPRVREEFDNPDDAQEALDNFEQLMSFLVLRFAYFKFPVVISGSN